MSELEFPWNISDAVVFFGEILGMLEYQFLLEYFFGMLGTRHVGISLLMISLRGSMPYRKGTNLGP